MKYVELFGKTFYINTVLPDDYAEMSKDMKKSFPGHWVLGIANSKMFGGWENIVITRELGDSLANISFELLLLSITIMLGINGWVSWWIIGVVILFWLCVLRYSFWRLYYIGRRIIAENKERIEYLSLSWEERAQVDANHRDLIAKLRSCAMKNPKKTKSKMRIKNENNLKLP